jgi:hypothetical protein
VAYLGTQAEYSPRKGKASVFDIPRFSNSEDYKEWVCGLTGRPIVNNYEDAPAGEINAHCTTFSSNGAEITLRPSLIKSHQHLEEVRAHEITHVYLRYEQSYVTVIPSPDTLVQEWVSTLVTMVEDLIVFPIVKHAGFPLDTALLDLVRHSRELHFQLGEISRSGTTIRWNLDPLQEKKIIFLPYVLGWGAIRLLELQPNVREPVLTYLTAVDNLAPRRVSQEIHRILRLIEQNDIWTASGYEAIIREIVRLWSLDSSVRYERYHSLSHS